MSQTPIRLCSVTLLYRQNPQLNDRALLQELQKRCGDVQQTSTTAPYVYMYLDYRAEIQGSAIPVQTMILPHEVKKSADDYETGFQQSWGWDKAREIVPQCQYGIKITDFMASNLERQARLKLMHQVVLSVLEITACDALYWDNSDHFADPAVYQEKWQSGTPNPLQDMLNIRMFNVENRAPGEMVMDSLGLNVLGLPDVQCHCAGLNPDTVASFLFNIANYLFLKGDIIEDGQTVPGFTPDSRWPCHHEISLVGPEREVLDIEPGPPYAVGRQ